MIGLLVIAALALVYSTERFLSVTEPVDSDVLVVEAWFWDRPGLQDAVQSFQQGNYQVMLVVGGTDSPQSEAPSSAELAGERLLQLGMESSKLVLISIPNLTVHRTYRSAVAVREWLREKRPNCRAVNVFTLGVHARKSRVMFRKALGPDMGVGIYACSETGYRRAIWCFSKRGLYIIPRNLVGYFYALLYRPE